MALGFLFLSPDERLLIHENMDSAIHGLFNIKETNITDRLAHVSSRLTMLYSAAKESINLFSSSNAFTDTRSFLMSTTT